MINKGIILAGGMGTRMLPATNNINKHLLPVYTHQGAIPMVYYSIRTLVSSGIDDILIISSKEHCGRIIENLGDGYNFNANFSYKIQDTSRNILGIASALKLCHSFTKNNKFAVILGDNFFENSFKEYFDNFSKGACIFVKEIEDASQFGVFFNNVIEEKPTNPKSNLAVAGLYLYTDTVYEVIDTIKPSKREELEITDVNNYYCITNNIQVNKIHGFWGDMGTPENIIQTQNFINKTNFKL